MESLNPYAPERVYDRSIPTRVGTVLAYSTVIVGTCSHALVNWPDCDEATWHDIDTLGAVPSDFDEKNETEEDYLTRKGRNTRPSR